MYSSRPRYWRRHASSQITFRRAIATPAHSSQKRRHERNRRSRISRPDGANDTLRRAVSRSFFTRIVFGIDVGNVEWADAVNLDDRFALGPGEMAHFLGHAHEAARRQRL